MPETTDNYHRIPVKDGGLFVKDSIRTISISSKKGIKALIGKLKSSPNGSTVVMTYLFDIKKWTMAEARAWVKVHEKKSFQYIMQMALSEIFCEQYGG